MHSPCLRRVGKQWRDRGLEQDCLEALLGQSPGHSFVARGLGREPLTSRLAGMDAREEGIDSTSVGLAVPPWVTNIRIGCWDDGMMAEPASWELLGTGDCRSQRHRLTVGSSLFSWLRPSSGLAAVRRSIQVYGLISVGECKFQCQHALGGYRRQTVT